MCWSFFWVLFVFFISTVAFEILCVDCSTRAAGECSVLVEYQCNSKRK